MLQNSKHNSGANTKTGSQAMGSVGLSNAGRGVTAVLGPTNTGKTHLAIERLTGYKTGVIGLPLRLLAREVYQRVCEKVGVANVALITGEEKIAPPEARYQVCTVEAMPARTDADFVAIDEVQLAIDHERGHTFTDRILHLRGVHETMLLGSDTIRETLKTLLPAMHVISRPRMSLLTYAGSKKITRLPRRSAIVAFSASEVYAIAELLRRQRGGAAVVTGSLSPRTRNAQVALYQSGDIDFLVATDAIGMGLNLDLHHVAFSQDTKFDGKQHRRLTAAEMAQIAGRAGRHLRDGTFGVTGHVAPLEDELVMALESHEFAQIKTLSWRNRTLEFSSIQKLLNSLNHAVSHPNLTKSPPATDQIALEALARNSDIADICKKADEVQLLWDVCKTPDFRSISPAAHAETLSMIFFDIAKTGRIDEDWFAAQVEHTNRIDGDIDALSARISQVRTWTYLSNRVEWMPNPQHWQEKTRVIEDRLSDALHESLTKRFVDRRTSVLMKRLRENVMLEAEIDSSGNVVVENHPVGRLHGFRFTPESLAATPEAKAANAAASKALAGEYTKRAERMVACPNSDIAMSSDGHLRWKGEVVASLTGSDDILKPKIIFLADEQLSGDLRKKAENRLERWLGFHVSTLLKPLSDLRNDEAIPGVARGIAFQLVENLGILQRSKITGEVKGLDQDMRASLRRHGVRFGAFHVFLPLLLKPAPSALICFLWALNNDALDKAGLQEVPEISAQGRTSAPINEEFLVDFYRLCGFRILGKKAVRIDILERLADLIRPTTMWKSDSGQAKPEGAIDGRFFYVTPAMMSILGATHEDMEMILKELGYASEKRLEKDVISVPQEKVSSPAKEEEKAEEKTAEKVEEAENSETSSASSADAAEEKAETVSTEPEAKSEAKSDAKPGADADKALTEKPEEPKEILVWRYGGMGGNRQKQFSGNKKGKGKGDPKGQRQHANKKAKPNDHKSSRPPRKEKPIDPDSPFAKLAALKQSMEKK